MDALTQLLVTDDNLNQEGRKKAIGLLYAEAEKAEGIKDPKKYKLIVRQFSRIVFHELKFHPVAGRMPCHYCSDPATELHHVRYTFPPKSEDIRQCCHACNMNQGAKPVVWPDA